MYIDNDEFGGWMQKLYAKLEELCKDVRVLRNADRVLPEDGKSSVRCPLKPKRFYPLKIFNNAPSKSLDRWGYYYFSLFPSVCRHLPDTFSV